MAAGYRTDDLEVSGSKGRQAGAPPGRQRSAAPWTRSERWTGSACAGPVRRRAVGRRRQPAGWSTVRAGHLGEAARSAS